VTKPPIIFPSTDEEETYDVIGKVEKIFFTQAYCIPEKNKAENAPRCSGSRRYRQNAILYLLLLLLLLLVELLLAPLLEKLLLLEPQLLNSLPLLHLLLQHLGPFKRLL
jgi:hypothetical protein